VNNSKIAKTPVYTFNGRPISPTAAFNAVDKIPDNKDKFSMTIIGEKGMRDVVNADWENYSREIGLHDKVNIWSVPADHWSLKDPERNLPVFVNTGNPTIYLQAPNGKVIHRQDNYSGPIDLGAIRKAIDSYDPRHDPDRRRVIPGWNFGGPILAFLCVMLFLGVVFLIGFLIWEKFQAGKKEVKPPEQNQDFVKTRKPKEAEKPEPKNDRPLNILVLSPEQAAILDSVGKPAKPNEPPKEEEKKE
jgi:hypothetical protein